MHDDGTPSRFSPDPEQAAALAKLLADARRWVPPDFDVDAFWFDLLGDLDLSMMGKLNFVQQMTQGEVPFDEIRELRDDLAQGAEHWNDLLGAETAETLRGVVRRFNLNPRDATALAALPPGNPDEDAAVQLLAFVRVADVADVTDAERLDLLRRAAAAGPTLPGVQKTLAKMYTILGIESPDPEEQKRLLREALAWITRAQRQRPDDPELNEDVAYTLEEVQQVSSEAEAAALIPRIAEHYAAALRHADETGVPTGLAVRALHGLALANWRLAMRAAGPDERRGRLDEAMAQIRQAVERADGEERPDLSSTAGAIALDLGWLPGDPADRRRAFEIARESYAAAEPEDEVQARHHQGSALVGLATLAAGAERAQLVARATELFAAAARGEAEDGHLDHSETRAWLHLAAASDGAERREAASRAVAAARRGLQREPGKGEYDLACALSLAGDLDEAARALAALAEKDPRIVQAALADADFAPLWDARPDLRAELERRGR